MHEVLDQHDIIAWDMDQTLIDGPNSAFYRSYIASTPNKQHHILTFRNHSWAKDIRKELHQSGLDTRNLIKSISNCPDIVHNAFMVDQFNRDHGRELDSLFWANRNNITTAAFEKHVANFPLWKGKQCHKIGATILVDDKPELVIAGCEKYGIAFLNALEEI